MASNLEVIKKIGKTIGKSVGKGISKPLEFIYFLPTFGRKYSEKEKLVGNDPRDYFNSYVLSIVINMVSTVVATSFIYSNSAGNESQKAYKILELNCCVSAATNTASWLYEWFRYEKNKESKKSTPVASAAPSPLEAKVETSQVKTEIKPTAQKEKIPDPWGIKIDEIKDLRHVKG